MKKVIAWVLALSLFSSNSLAISHNDSCADSNYSAAYVSMVEAKREAMYSELRAQLTAQNAMHLYSVFKEVLDREIDNSHYMRSPSGQVYAPNGGVVCYGDSTCDVIVTYLDEEATQELDDGRDSPQAVATSETLLLAFGELLVNWFEDLFDVLMIIYDTVTAYTWSRIHNGTGCSFSIWVEDYGDGVIRTSFYHWSGVYYMSVPDSGDYDYVTYEVF